MQATWLADVAVPNRDRHERLLVPIRVPTDISCRFYRQGKATDCPETEPSSRANVQLAVDTARGEELEAINRQAVTLTVGPLASRMYLDKGRNIR